MGGIIVNSYREITQAAAWDIMQHEKGFVILDVRRPEEYAGGHIKGAVNVPLETIDGREIPELPDKDQEILVYCRSGVRSKQAAGKPAAQGYEKIEEFGGILTWPYGTVK